MLERIIAAVSPGWAARRAHARIQWRGLVAYEGGKIDRRTSGWNAPATGPNAQVGPYIRRLRNRARQLVRDNPYANRIVRIQAAHQIGFGITPRANTGDEVLDKQVNDLWSAWVARADINGQLDFYSLQHLAARARAESGESIVRLRRLPAAIARSRRLPVPLQIEVIEGDLLDDQNSATLAGGARIVQGVEFDSAGARVAYHLLLEHPGESLGLASSVGVSSSTERVPARDILHLYRIDRPGQVRGISDFAPVLLRLDALGNYEDAALEKARIEACMTAFVIANADPSKGPLASTLPTGAAADTPRQVGFGSGMVNFLRPGESVETVAPTGAGQFEPLALHYLTGISAGTGVTYDQTTGDLRQANFSSLRAGKIEFRRATMQDQWLLWIPRLCQPVWDAWVDQAILAGALPDRPGGYPVKWSPPAMEMVDPTREVPAAIAAIRAGLQTLPDAIGERGEDWRAQLAEIKDANDALDAAGIILDSDPRRTAASGSGQMAGTAANPDQQPQEPPA